ncbi:MAG TPA: RluA family pseudouridine synthase [Niabella sp.]|nr:RluA family pseudouridine synthase [Niabella sp.]HOZ97344.1 RluA family pseudouridine synthase [Niabella sp.]HQW15385.1 RluA family pseudouridine synthase [Niabella sp.]HQX20569.1 RluA family pseudouridine synthase [Niabella sp.]HQX40954.1 RluA family pseudouridine synthase [Niabella sp.]
MSETEILSEVQDTNDELYQKFVFKTDAGQEPYRIDKFLMNRIEGATRNKIQQAIHNKMVLVNGNEVKPNFKIKANQEIVVYTDTVPDANEILPENIPLTFFYEDEDIIIINKKPGMVVHPGSGNHNGTLLNGIAWHLQQQNAHINAEQLPRFGLVHRIDKNTSGLLVLAKTELAMRHLAKQFFDHTVDRKYIALVWGDVEQDEGTIVAHVGRNQRYRKLFEAYPEGEHGKEAITHYRVLERFGYVTLVECVLETGRTHQIRVHMKYIGHPLFNDDFYGGDKIVKGTVYAKYKQFVGNCFELCNRQALHAKTLGLVHPVKNERMFFDSDLPEDLTRVIEKWRKYTAGKNE